VTPFFASDVHPPSIQIEIPQAEVYQFRHAQPVAIRHQHQEIIPHAVSPVAGSFEKALHLGIREEVFPPPIHGPFGVRFGDRHSNSLHYSG
jgi:hypothetical protein